MDKAQSMEKQIGTINREMELLRFPLPKCFRQKKPIMEMKNAFDGLNDWTCLRKDSLSYRTH